MKVLVVSDFHNQNSILPKLKNHLEKNKYDLAICPGDITQRQTGNIEYLESFLKIFSEKNLPLYAVHGNNDDEAVQKIMREKGISLHLQEKKVGDYRLVGIGGWGDLEEDILEGVSVPKVDEKTILVTHVPPRIREFQNLQNAPYIHISGHIHRAQAFEKINSTWLLQTPSAMFGRAAILEPEIPKVEFIDL